MWTFGIAAFFRNRKGRYSYSGLSSYFKVISPFMNRNYKKNNEKRPVSNNKSKKLVA
jgi:hypothetical protein